MPFDLANLNRKTIKQAIADLNDHCPIENLIKSRLQSMWFNAEKKQIAVLQALYTIKNASGQQNSSTAIQQALENSESELFKALNMQRYSFSASKTDIARSAKQTTAFTNTTKETFPVWESEIIANSDQSRARFKIIQILPKQSQEAILTAQNNYSTNALMLAARFNPQLIPDMLAAIAKLSAQTQEAIFTARSKYNWNALMIAVRYKPELVPNMLAAIANLSTTAQEAIFTAQTGDYWNALMMAVQNNPQLVPDMLAAIANLSKTAQEAIFTAQTGGYWNALMLAARFNPQLIPDMLTAIAKLESNDQITLIMQGFSFDAYLKDNPDSLPDLLKAIAQFNPTIKDKIVKDLGISDDLLTIVQQNFPQQIANLNKISGSFVAKYKYRLIEKAIADLNDSCPLERAIKSRLKSMWFNAEKKKIAILQALYTIKNASDQQNSSTAIKAALKDSESDLFRALNMQRNGPDSSTLVQSASIKQIIPIIKTYEKIFPDWVEAITANDILSMYSLFEQVKKLPQSLQIEFFTAQNNNNDNALMLSLRYSNSIRYSMIQAIAKLPTTAQKAIFTAQNNDNYNALMLAAQKNPSIVPDMLKAMAELPPQEQEAIFKAQTSDNRNALLLATYHNPHCVPAILDAIAKLPENIQIVLTEHFSFGIYEKNNRIYTEKVLAAINRLTLNAQQQMGRSTPKIGPVQETTVNIPLPSPQESERVGISSPLQTKASPAIEIQNISAAPNPPTNNTQHETKKISQNTPISEVYPSADLDELFATYPDIAPEPQQALANLPFKLAV